MTDGTDPAPCVESKGKKSLSGILQLWGGFALNINKKYIFRALGIHKWRGKEKMRKSNGWITNSSEASRDCGSTSYIILSICIVHWEQQQSRYFEIKNNLEGENKLTVYHIVEREREFVLGNNQYSCMSSNWVSPVFLQDVTVTTELFYPFDGFGCAAAVNRECTRNGFGLSSASEHQLCWVPNINQGIRQDRGTGAVLPGTVGGHNQGRISSCLQHSATIM